MVVLYLVMFKRTLLSMKTADAFVCRDFIDAPVTAIGDKVYVTWATNKSGNWEIMFRASNDSGITFADKINYIQITTSNRYNCHSITQYNKTMYIR